MGTEQSSHAIGNNDNRHLPDSSLPTKGESLPDGVGGRKSAMPPVAAKAAAVAPGQVASIVSVGSAIDAVLEGARMLAVEDKNKQEEEFDAVSETEDSTEEEWDEDDEEEDEEWEERLRVLEDARTLKRVARFFLHPERPVEVDGTATARCFFDRASAASQECEEEEMEAAAAAATRVLRDVEALKELAADYMHPEAPVRVSDPAVRGRNYFDRCSAPQPEVDEEETEGERAAVLEDAVVLKRFAADYAHPEAPVAAAATTAAADARARNYFSRPSAAEPDCQEDEGERIRVFQDLVSLRAVAADYLHPEVPVGETADATAFGRNYFARPSAPEREIQEREDEGERARVFEDVAALKKLAADYLHPEAPVRVTDPAACGRNYFSRPSAADVEHDDDDEEEERVRVFEDAAALKTAAAHFMHPEVPVSVADPSCGGRNYFSRASAAETEGGEDDTEEERAAISQEVAALKNLAADHLHPELPVSTTDPTATGRNYFSRLSAPRPGSVEDDQEERSAILEDALTLKKLAKDYLHPELSVAATDPTARGRNYFSRPSAPQQDVFVEDDQEERTAVLEEAMTLRKLATDYMHPERSVTTTDYAVFGRNYFSRPSAPQPDVAVEDDQQERVAVLEEAAALKEYARGYLHPEVSLATTDPTAKGRNYFSRPSAPRPDIAGEDREERIAVLADATFLKKLAKDYMHPHLSVATTDPAAFGRNYFSRPSAPERDDVDDEEERSLIMEDAAALSKLAKYLSHPELPVGTADGTAFGRNFFRRPSAADGPEDQKEMARILEDAAALKKVAARYLHPERPVANSDPAARGRNYFSRASAPPPQREAQDEAERARIAADARALRQLAVHRLHPELPASAAAGACGGRNYFDRPSAPGHGERIHTFPPHEDDVHHEEHHHEHLDHFGMDEDMDAGSDEARKRLSVPGENKRSGGVEGEEGEGNLSRSPSSVVLLAEEPSNY